MNRGYFSGRTGKEWKSGSLSKVEQTDSFGDAIIFAFLMKQGIALKVFGTYCQRERTYMQDKIIA
jgi:hypothetical protein